MINAEIIEVTILDGGGISFQNGDELKRLCETGFLKASAAAKATVRRTRGLKTSQACILKQLKEQGIRDLDHYRRVVGNPRTNGLLHHFKSGMVLQMEMCPHPNDPKIAWYVMLDTAIGASVHFIEALSERGSIRVSSLSGRSGE